MEDKVESALDLARRRGASYAEVRYQSDIQEASVLKNGVPEIAGLERRNGMSVRVIVDGGLGFASTNILTKRSIKKSVRKALAAARAASKMVRRGISLSEAELGEGEVQIKPRVRFDCVDMDSRMEFLREVDKAAEEAANKGGAGLPARMLQLDTLMTERLVMSSDGARVYSMIPRVALNFFLTAFDVQKGTAQRFGGYGEAAGWESVEKWDLQSKLSQEAFALAKTLLEANSPPTGEVDMVLGQEVVGLVCHESSGHPGEADRILGREAAQAGETYLKPDSIGLRVGSEAVNVVDDPQLPNSFGYYLYDEEGVKARKRVLIKEGVINEFLHNRETAAVFGIESNGSSRSNAYDREPIVRMANTFLEPGDYSKEELIEDVKHGVYIKNFMEWNIDDRRFNQRYVGLEAYRIENGELRERVRNPVIEMTTIGFWSAVDAVAQDLEFQAAYCGKGDPMQGMPVWVGGPHARLRKVRLGGRPS